jgi:uncharacterized protein YndB with AHSA1/START domain
MQLLIRIFAIILIGFILLCFVIGITSKPQTEFTQTKVINSPGTVVWQALTSPVRMSEWMRDVRVVTGPSHPHKDAVYRFYLYNYDENAFHEEKIDIYNPEQKISFLRAGHDDKPLLKNYLRLYELKQLRDGKTELTLKLSYRSNSFLTIIYDRLMLEQQIKKRESSNLDNLKKTLEKL